MWDKRIHNVSMPRFVRKWGSILVTKGETHLSKDLYVELGGSLAQGYPRVRPA